MENEKIPCKEIKLLTRDVDRLAGEQRHMKSQIDGNGDTGIAKKVVDHEKFINKQIGSLSMLKFIILLSLGQGVAVVGLTLRVFKVI